MSQTFKWKIIMTASHDYFNSHYSNFSLLDQEPNSYRVRKCRKFNVPRSVHNNWFILAIWEIHSKELCSMQILTTNPSSNIYHPGIRKTEKAQRTNVKTVRNTGRKWHTFRYEKEWELSQICDSSAT